LALFFRSELLDVWFLEPLVRAGLRAGVADLALDFAGCFTAFSLISDLIRDRTFPEHAAGNIVPDRLRRA
jgi:hypothetical protein